MLTPILPPLKVMEWLHCCDHIAISRIVVSRIARRFEQTKGEIAMKQAVMALVLGCGVAGISGCAEMQQQAGSLLGQPAQPQQVAMEGGQAVQTLGGVQSSAVAQEGSSMASDMTKEAASTLKNEVSSSIRSAIRGAFSR